MSAGQTAHLSTPEDVTIIRCERCGWHSPELSRQAKDDRGVPWYCDQCGERVYHFITFSPDERSRPEVAAWLAIMAGQKDTP